MVEDEDEEEEEYCSEIFEQPVTLPHNWIKLLREFHDGSANFSSPQLDCVVN